MEKRGEQCVRGRGVSNPHLLSGLLYCRCGSRMGPKTKGRQGGPTYYRCYREAEVEPCPVQGGYHDASALEEAIVAHFLAHMNSPAIRLGLAEKLQAQKQDDRALFTSALHQLQQQRQQLAEELRFIDKQYRRQEITIAEARRLRAGVEADVAPLLARQAHLQDQLDQTDQANSGHTLVMTQLDLAQQWDMLDTLQKKQVMQHFVLRIEAYRPKGGEPGYATATVLRA